MLLSLRSLYEASGVSNGNALRFDNTASGASYFQFTGPALPNADWCVGYCIRPDNRSETSSYQYTVSVGTLGAAGSLQLFMPSVGSAAATPFYIRHLPDQGGTEVNQDSASLTLPQDGSDWWFIVQRRASVYEMFAVRENTTAVAGNSIPVVAGSIASKTWRIGGRTDNGANRWLLNPLGEFFVLTNDSLTASEITTLATGKHITEVRTTRAVDLRFRANNSVEPDLSGNGRDATRFGTAFTLVDPFFNESVSNTAPVAVNDSATTAFQTVLNFDPRTNDTDAQGNSLSVNSATLQSGQGSVTFNASGISYVPGVGFSGTAVIAYTVSDGSLTSNTATVTVTVLAGSNTAPVAVNDSYTTAFQTQLVFDPRTNDTDAESNPITINGATLSTGQGTVSFTSTSITYTPGAGFSGPATINYTITDGGATSNSATITVTVGSASSSSPTIGQHFKSTGTLTTSAVTTTGGLGTVFLILVCDGTLSGDNKGNTYTQLQASMEMGNNQWQRLYVCANGVGGTGHTWTVVNGSGTVTHPTVLMVEVLNAASSGAVEASAAWVVDATNPRTSGSLTASANSMLLSFSVTDSTSSVATWSHLDGSTPLDSESNGGLWWTAESAYRIISTPGSVSASYDYSDTAAPVITTLVSIKAVVTSTLTFSFNETNGTTLEAIDPRWAGDSTGFYTSNGVITSNTPWNDVTARFEAAQGDTQKVQAVAKAGGFTGGEVRGLVLQNTTGQSGYVFTIGSSGDAFNFNRNGVFIANWAGTTGLINTLNNDVVLRAEYNHLTGLVRLYANDILAGSYTDPAPLTGGFPGIRLNNGGTIGATAFDDWTDLSAQGAVLVRALTISSGRYAMLSSGQLGQGIKPLVLVSGQKRLRAVSEGVPLVIGADGRLRTLAPNETLEI